MWKDPIVEEIHQIREQIAKAHDYDIHKLFAYYRKKQRESGRQYVSRSSRQTDNAGTTATH